MENIKRKIYFTPIAEKVIVDGNDVLLDENYPVFSFQQGSDDDVVNAKPTGALEFQSEIWDTEMVSETE